MYAEEGFDSFWNEYPKKRSKGDALKAWKAVKEKRPPIAQLLKALAVLKASDDWRKDGGQFIPYPGTWLRAWGWEDVPQVDMSGLVNGKMWWETVTGIEKKADELGIKVEDYESWQHFKHGVFRAAGHNVRPITSAVVDKKLASAGG